jgi:hypothetical protein
MDSIKVVNDAIAALKPHLPGLADPAARALYETIGTVLQRRGAAHLLGHFAGRPEHEADIKRALRLAIRDEPHVASLLGGATVAARANVAPPAVVPPQTHQAAPVIPEPDVSREDLLAAIDATPPPVRQAILVGAARCVELVDTTLAEDERITAISSASLNPESAVNCLLVLTDRRLLFVTPRPEAIAFELPSVKQLRTYLGYFSIQGSAGKYSFGLSPEGWSEQFLQYVLDAAALAVLGRH